MGPTRGPTLTDRTSPTAPPLAVAIDGGNSKTEVVVLERTTAGWEERARAIGAGSGAGPAAVCAAVSAQIEAAAVDPSGVAVVTAAVAGLDFPGDEVAYRVALAELFPHAEVEVVGDAVAVLEAGARAGHSRSGDVEPSDAPPTGATPRAASARSTPAGHPPAADALAIVCGAGLNAVARGPHGIATVPALGWPSGDGGGGGDELGRQAVRAAARAEDGRGPATTLLGLVLGETAAADTIALARAIRDGEVTMRQVGALAPVVARAAAEGDAVACELVARAAGEAVLLAGVVARRAWGGDGRVPAGTPAVLAGGMFADPGFRAAVAGGLRERGFEPRQLEFRPVDGLIRALHERTALPVAAVLPDPS